MNPVVRSILAVVAGILVAFVIIALVEGVGSRIYPLPPGVDARDPESLKAVVAQMPLGALLFVLLAWTAGSVAGGWVAARFAPTARMSHAMILAALLLVAGVANLLAIPHPAWMWVAGIAVFPLGAWSGARAAGAGTPAGPAGA